MGVAAVAVGVFLALAALGSAIGHRDDAGAGQWPGASAAIVSPAASPTPSPTPSPTSLAVEPTEAPTEEPVTAAPRLTAEQENAIGTAEDYLAYAAFSRSGLIDQLKYEGYSKAAAAFAVDHITVNWKEQAYLMAKSYLDYTHFSRSGLISQLKYEGFSTKEATYGVTKAGL